MRALRIPGGGTTAPEWLENQRIQPQGDYDEAWLQRLLFEQPALIPLNEIAPGAGAFIPVCRELPLPRGGSTVFLDLLGVTAAGGLSLIECKLWRNPQARREVIAQVLEYAALLQRWSYGDLSSALLRRLPGGIDSGAANPLYEIARRAAPDLVEADFVDAVSHTLARGAFDLIIAGDGIRSDLETIASYVENQSGAAARISLVEFQLWTERGGSLVVIPTLQLKTEIIERRLLVDGSGTPVRIADEEPAREIEEQVDADAAARRASEQARNRGFWQRFIDDARVNHPDQALPRHGGNNYVALSLPDPADRLVVYRTKAGTLGVFFLLSGDDGLRLFEWLEQEAGSLESEFGLPLAFGRNAHASKPQISTTTNLSDLPNDGDDDQIRWLEQAMNAFIDVFRPRITAFSAGER